MRRQPTKIYKGTGGHPVGHRLEGALKRERGRGRGGKESTGGRLGKKEEDEPPRHQSRIRPPYAQQPDPSVSEGHEPSQRQTPIQLSKARPDGGPPAGGHPVQRIDRERLPAVELKRATAHHLLVEGRRVVEVPVVCGAGPPEPDARPTEKNEPRPPSPQSRSRLRPCPSQEHCDERHNETARSGKKSRDKPARQANALPPFLHGTPIPLPGLSLLPGLRPRPKPRKVGKAVPCGPHHQQDGLSKRRGLGPKVSKGRRGINEGNENGRKHRKPQKGAETAQLVSQQARWRPVEQLKRRRVRIGQKDVRRGHRKQAGRRQRPQTKPGCPRRKIRPVRKYTSRPAQHSQQQSVGYTLCP